VLLEFTSIDKTMRATTAATGVRWTRALYGLHIVALESPYRLTCVR
jgi:hypothetical protein